MFDFEDGDLLDKLAEHELEQNRERAEAAAAELAAEAWAVRRDACKVLGELGEAAQPYMGALLQLAKTEIDYEVKQAVRGALAQLHEAGLRPPTPPAEESSGSALPALLDGSDEVARPKYVGPQARFQILGEILTMRIERDGMRPTDFTDIWEKQWGLQYAGRIRFVAPKDSPSKFLNPREDIVPRSPFTVKLECGVGSILTTLAAMLKKYTDVAPDEVEAEHRQALEQQVAQAQQRAANDAREKALLDQKYRRRELRLKGKEHLGAPRPFSEHRILPPRAPGKKPSSQDEQADQ